MGLSVIKKIFSFSKYNNKKVVEALLSAIINDSNLSVPIYVKGMVNEAQGCFFGDLYPLQYVWNEYESDEGQIGFSLSTNGMVVGRMLETLVPRENLNFILIRDEVMGVLSSHGNRIITNMIERSLSLPSNFLKNFEYNNVININFSNKLV